ncbi:MAG: MurT ligase domain-containing protein [Bacillota bacterium]
MKRIRLYLAFIVSKAVLVVIRLLGRGKGSSLPGSIALKIYPGFIGDLRDRLQRGLIVVTGTNGKTTTNNMLARVLEGSGFRVLVNREGANLITGIASALAREMDITGRRTFDYACFEVDEAAFPAVAARVKPNYVVITNFFRDQLDRYGELDRTVSLVGNSLKGLEGARLILNADDPLVAQLSINTGLQAVFYGMAEHGEVQKQGSEAREAKFCPFCGRELSYLFYHYSQLGSYKCSGCSFSRPLPDVEGVSPRSGANSVSCQARFRQGSPIPLNIPVYGMYNLYNALAAFSTAVLLGIGPRAAAEMMAGYRPATGRMERFLYRGKPVYLNLVKNPTGFNAGLEALLKMTDGRVDTLIAINDNGADGRDISWLWDVDFEILEEHRESFGEFVCSGQRAEEMAIRLKYAGIPDSRLVVKRDFREAIDRLLSGGAEKLYIMATYTALWPVERILSGYAERDRIETEHMPYVS